jgi:outer membrane protein insertion porin family
MEEVILILLRRLVLMIFLSAICFLQVNAADLTPEKGAIIERIDWATPTMKRRFNTYFKDLAGKPFDNLTLKIQVDAVLKELFSSGYFNATVKPELLGTTKKIVIRMSIELKGRINFEFQGNQIFSHQELRAKLLDKIRNEFGKADIQALSDYIADEYENAGFYQTKVTYYQEQGLDLEKLKSTNYHFVIDEGNKVEVKDITYRGNSYLTIDDINKIFKKNATALAKGGFYDRKFFDQFSDILKKEYLSRGFVFIEVSQPRVVTDEENDSVSIEYGIVEKQQVVLKNITLPKLTPEIEAHVRSSIINKEGAPVNIIELENDLRKIIVTFQDEGYYFATITNLNSDTLLVYDKSYTTVDLRPQISLDRKICYNEAIINGNVHTKTEVINREIELKTGELITPSKLEYLRQKLSGLNLFASLRITPYMMYESEEIECPKTNLVIQVKEKDFGLIEVAPGYRTDLGAKLSTGITYNNLNGMNRSASLRLEGNRRFNLDGFDDRRKKENKKLFEYSVKTSVTEPYLFYNVIKTHVEFELPLTFQRIRYTSFDADILRLSPQISKTFTKNFSGSVKYQFERIVQFDATNAKDDDNFSIGGITPTLTLDLRDDVVNPKKGAFFTISSEWANSNFGSMKEKDLEVNFVKVISRNRFYYPVGDFVLALSLAAGYQKNFAEEILKDDNGNVILNDNGQPKTRGYIPSIKVFRLDGYDEIRGYDDGEINRLMDGTEIGDVIVQREAYFTALKFEPRYSLTDNVKLGVFFDAGRVFVNDFQPMKLRSSVGAGIKYVTPVGSLDLDYGFKLQRRTYPDLTRDSVGRLHLSIGFF